jgi:hypothetical protein
MAGKTLDLNDLLTTDQLACRISDYWHTWNVHRQTKLDQWQELRQYVYATDTTQTSNSKLDWNNKTTIPKLCQIRDNLYANYMATMFPKRKNILWEGNSKEDQERQKTDAIRDYMQHCIDQPWFKDEVSKLVYDYIDYGNVFVTTEWKDDRIQRPDSTKVGYVGPIPRRISPLDIVFNPTAPSFAESPKIIRSLVSLGEVKEVLTRLTKTPEELEQAEDLYKYMKDMRHNASRWASNVAQKDDYYKIDGFDSYQAYLQSDYVEVLTFYGDLYDRETDEYLRNYVITVVDRHRIAFKAPNPSYFGRPTLYHSGWRKRQDNLWAMGPLDNLVGMQYRIDHIENMKADMFDLTVFPPLKIKGYVEDFVWGPMEHIHVGDEGDVELMTPQFQVLQANMEISTIEMRMEEMAGAPKEAMGFRTPGEKTMYEVQRLENAASRVFQSKIGQFEEQVIEPLLNAMLELAKRNMDITVVGVLDDEFRVRMFKQISMKDISGEGRIRPVAARHFAEKAETVQNLNNFFSSVLGQDPDIKAHFSSVKLAKMFEELLDLKDWEVVLPFVRLSEMADAQRLSNAQQEETDVQAMTPAGISQGDV